jgi:hypothetical protein
MKAAVLTLGLLVVAAVGFLELNKPRARDCIAGFHVDWSGIENRDYVRDRLYDGYVHRFLKQQVTFAALHDFAFQDDDRRFYMLFNKNCTTQAKAAIASLYFEFWRSEGLRLPRFEPIPEPILPSPFSTISAGVGRRHWRD